MKNTIKAKIVRGAYRGKTIEIVFPEEDLHWQNIQILLDGKPIQHIVANLEIHIHAREEPHIHLELLETKFLARS